MQSRFQRVKSEWTHRLRELGREVGHSTTTSASSDANPPATAFRSLLELFAHETDALDQLDHAFDVDEGQSLIFFVPQLISFLLHGALYSSPVLEEWILDKCQRNVYFAHRCYWFLRSWCLEVPPETIVTRSSFDSPNNGGNLIPFLDEPASVDDHTTMVSCRPREDTKDKFLPQERAMIERLMMRIRDVGSQPARVLEMGPGDALEVDDQLPGASPAAMVEAAEQGQIPVDPTSGYPSVRHFDALMTEKTHGFGFGPSFPESDFFDRTPRFLDALIFLAENLFLTPREERRDSLRQQLQALECELLPSNSIYLPIGSTHHRVWRIVADESIPISTKERVPCIVALEVIDHRDQFPERQGSPGESWQDSFLRRRVSSIGEAADETPGRLDHCQNEHDVLFQWRYGYRDPLRRVSLLDKVTTTVKVPLERMKTQVREHLRSRTNSDDDELRVLVRKLLDDQKASQAEQDSQSKAPQSSGLTRTNSAGSLVSLGQWSNPQPPIVTRAASYSEGRKASPQLPYGSDDDLMNKVGEPTKEVKPTRPPPVVFRESWKSKEERVREKSAFGSHPGWRLLPILIKANDDLRQEQLASQLIQRMAMILARERVPVWLCPYEILALTDRGGIIEAIPDTISLDSLKKNSSGYSNLREFFHLHFGEGTEELAAAKANFVESLAAYSMICFLLQIKDRHNGNILLDKHGHLVHIDFGFFLLSSPGKNAGFESAPFKLTREFVEVLDGPESHMFRTFRDLCFKTFLALRRNCMEIILVVEMLKEGNEELQCFRGRPGLAIQQLKERFRLDLNDRACKEYVNSLVDDSIENWRTKWYDRYQRYFVGVL